MLQNFLYTLYFKPTFKLGCNSKMSKIFKLIKSTFTDITVTNNYIGHYKHF